MNLEILSKRLEEIEKTIVGLNNQLNVLHGHRTEVHHWISQLAPSTEEPKGDQPVVNPSENPVE